jgi:hypothetical protein
MKHEVQTRVPSVPVREKKEPKKEDDDAGKERESLASVTAFAVAFSCKPE